MSSLKPPLLTQAQPGQPFTIGRWNAVVGAIDGLYGELAATDRECLEVAATWRGEPVRDARVIGIALDPAGPPIAAVAPIGDLDTHTLVGVREGTWRIQIDAPGFAPAAPELRVEPKPGAALPALVVECRRTVLPAPDLIGMPIVAARKLVGWAGLLEGAWEPLFAGPSERTEHGIVRIQAPTDLAVPGQTAMSALLAGVQEGDGPARTVVPDLLGSFVGLISATAADFSLGLGSLDQPGAQVVWQSVEPGTMVTAGSGVNVRLGVDDVETATFGMYQGTHRALAQTRVSAVLDASRASGSASMTPWRIARVYASDKELDAVKALFAGFKAVPSAQPGEDLEALWRSLNVVGWLRAERT